MFRPRLAPLVLALALAGCDSTIHMTGAPANAPLGVDAGVPARLVNGPAGRQVAIDNPGLLPAAVRAATNLKVAFGGTLVPVSRTTGGQYVFSIPTTARVQQDVAGNLAVVFVMEDVTSQIVQLRTGSPIAFGQPAIETSPAPAFLVRGLPVHLKANTQADPKRYQFTWSYSSSGQAPFLPIAGAGSEVDWTPPAAGNFFVRVDALDLTNQQVYSATTPDAIVFVTDAKGVVTTNPPTGSVQRGSAVALAITPPAPIANANLSYAWSASQSPQGPFQSIPGSGATTSFLPTAVGSYYVRVDATDRTSGKVYSFLGPDPLVFVSESRPLIGVSKASANRGEAYTLTLNAPGAGTSALTWYYAVTSGTAAPAGVPASYNFQRLPGNGASIDAFANEVGAYVFRVDVPQADGTIKSFVSNDAQLNVTEATPLIQTDPPNLVTQPGTGVSLVLNARDIDETQFRFTWSVTTNPLAGFQPLPVTGVRDTNSKRYSWAVPQQQTIGAYYVKVEAARLDGTGTYTFTSSGPAVNLQCPAGQIVLPGGICQPAPTPRPTP